MPDEVKKIGEQLMDVRLAIRELSVKLDRLKDLSEKLDDIEKVAHKAHESTQSAHHRLDDLKKREEAYARAVEISNSSQAGLERIEKWFVWVPTVVFGAIILGIVGYMINGGFKIK
jgi:uncharacterized coiled-coil DUF342 family protein